MARILKTKELLNTKLANNYGGWIYCTKCNQNIGYLCYVTYDRFKLEYECNCGSKGCAVLAFEELSNPSEDVQALKPIKNRSCCPNDESPLFTILKKKVQNYHVDVVCNHCNHLFHEEG